MTRPGLTSSQTVGPFFHDCLLRDDARCDVLANDDVEGTRIRVEGHVIDGNGAGVPDAMLEVWQSNHHGRYNHPNDQRDLPIDPTFTGYGRIGTQPDGGFHFTTVKPGAVPFDERQLQAPHILVAVFGRGLLNHLYTRIYFDDEPATANDPILLAVDAERRSTLIARRDVERERQIVYRLDIVLQGAGETVFFDLGTRR